MQKYKANIHTHTLQMYNINTKYYYLIITIMTKHLTRKTMEHHNTLKIYLNVTLTLHTKMYLEGEIG